MWCVKVGCVCSVVVWGACKVWCVDVEWVSIVWVVKCAVPQIFGAFSVIWVGACACNSR